MDRAGHRVFSHALTREILGGSDVEAAFAEPNRLVRGSHLGFESMNRDQRCFFNVLPLQILGLPRSSAFGVDVDAWTHHHDSLI
jgi:hypothetical protein